MNQGSRIFDELGRLMNEAAGVAGAARREVEMVLKAQVERFVNDLDLVRREDYDVLREQVQIQGEEIDQLRKELAALRVKKKTEIGHPKPLRLAVISDIHGNRLALEAVLADIARAGCDATVNLGDVASGPLDPTGTLERLMPQELITVRGNHDRWILEPPTDEPVPVDRFAAGRLSADHRDWLAALPAQRVIDGSILLCHGTPDSDTIGWLDGWFTARNTTLPDEAFVTFQAKGYAHELFLCGHTHLARAVRLRSGQLIVNPGAVGLQVVHGSPDARYAMVERVNGGWVVELRAVPYDCHAAATQCAANGFSHWAEAITTGWADPDGLF